MKNNFFIKKIRPFSITLLSVFMLESCVEINTSDAHEAFINWAGTKPNNEIKLLNGQYWQSSHWTKEYIVYLKFNATDKWWNDFLKENSISKDKENWTIPNDAPKWFNPHKNYIRYGGGDDFDQGSRYFQDTISGAYYVYEIQL